MYKKITLLLLLLISFTRVFTQSNEAPIFWSESSDVQFRSSLYEREIVPEKYVTYTFDAKQLQTHLENALTKTYTENRSEHVAFYLPNPSGEMELYHIWRDDLLPKKLNERYPEISVFAGYAVNDPSKTARIDITSKGFRAVSYGPDNSTYYIDPIAKGVQNTVISYYRKDFKSSQEFKCLVDEMIEVEDDSHSHSHGAQRIAGDCNLHTFELALSCTGEYATFHGGTKTSVMAEYVTSINRINGLYEKEVSVNLVFVSNTDDLIYLDATTDPFTNNDGGTMLSENQTTCDNVIGSANYDIGHVYSTGGGGIARLQSPCSNGSKAQGVTGLPSPTGDPFYVDYVAHEMGHQFGATHTFNNSCSNNRTASTAFEPGSGSTIMAYAGICAPNVQFSSDAYFHSASLVQIGDFITGTSCQQTTSTGSDRPVIGSLSDYNIPVGTPFELVANATTSDGSTFTYCWEQMDNEIADMSPETDATDGPMFRSYTPTISNSRYFPSLPYLLDNSDNEWEVLPGATRELNFRVTVRGSVTGLAGCVEESDLVLNVTDASGPFEVITPNTSTVWTVGETQAVSWQVANTTASPVSCDEVSILMSIDGGYTYPITLMSQTPNDGQVDITVPNNPGTLNRIRVQSVNNVFFDISNENLTIIEPIVPTFTLSASPSSLSVCSSNDGTVTYDIDATALSGFNSFVEYTVVGLPNGVNGTFDNNNSVPDATTVLNLTGLESVSTGLYTFTVEATGGGQSDNLSLQIDVIDSSPNAADLVSPVNAAVGVSTTIPLTWMDVDFANEYVVELSDNPNFNTIIYTENAITTESTVAGLSSSTVYYWRVRPINICGDGPIETVFRFRTGAESCNTYENTTSTSISTTAGTINSIINVPNGAAIESISMSTVILHSWIGDLDCTLIPPTGISLSIFEQPGVPDTNFGCSNDNIRATFDDAATNSADDFEAACGFGSYAIDADYQPIDAFSNLDGNNSTGDWTLQITDNVNDDGGSLNSWSLEICTNTGSNTPPSLVSNNPLTVTQSTSENISTNELSFLGSSNTDNIIYTLFTLPSEGTLMLNNVLMQVGDSFTQTDIDNGTISYNHNGGTALTDSFIYDVEEIGGGWAPENTFQINIVQLSFSAISMQVSGITCHNGNDGSISITPDGGTAPYTYSIDGVNFQTGNTFSNLSAGTYSFTVVDSDNNMTTTNMVVLANPSEIVLQGTVTDNSVSLSAVGGTGNLMYSLDNTNFQSSSVFNNLANGDYTFYVVDNNGCTASTAVITILTNNLGANISIVSTISCFGANDASISVSNSGGTAPFMYSLNGGTSQSSNFFENLAAGDYTVDVVDANNFSVTTNTITISNPSLLELALSANGDQITATATGGTGNYQYSLDGINYQNDNTFSGLTNGDYTITVRDDNNCIDTETINIDIATLTVNAMVSQQLLCNGDASGTILAFASGGIAPYQFGMSNNFQDSGEFTNLSVGTYIIVVQDATGNQSNITVELTQPDAITIQVSTDLSSATINAQGGTGNLTYSMDGVNFQFDNYFSGLSSGDYTAYVMDSNGCQVEADFSISINMLSATATESTPLLCAGDSNASIVVNATDGTLPYSYSIDGVNFQASNTFTNLAAGQYTITVQDADAFTTTASVQITEPATLTLSAVVLTNTVTLTASGGTGNLTYSIDGVNFQFDNYFSDLSNGYYTAYVMDSNGCQVEADFSISVNNLIAIASISSPITCNNEVNGGIVVETSGGTNPKEYSIDGTNFQSSNFFEDLGPGEYTIIVRDANGLLTTTNSVTLVNPALIEVSVTVMNNVATISATGGTGTLSYSVDGMTFTNDNTFTSLDNGTYTAYVQDQNDCLVNSNFTVDYIQLEGSISLTGENLCTGDANVTATVNATGGTAPYMYNLNGGAFSAGNVFDMLSAGNYTISVQDADGEVISLTSFTVTDPAPLNLVVQITDNAISIIAEGGTAPYQYSTDGVNFQNSNIFDGFTNGNYTAIVQDANGCTADTNFNIDIIESLSLDIMVLDIIDCTAQVAGNITAAGMGGTPPYLYSLNEGPFETTNVFENLEPGQYNVEVQDAALNFVSNIVVLTAPNVLELDIEIVANTATINVTGGTAPYSYSLDGGQSFSSIQVFDELASGDYEVIVTDANGCEISQMFTINSVSVSYINENLLFYLQPNPAQGHTQLLLDIIPNETLEISIFDILGRTVRTYKDASQTSVNTYDLDINGLLSGTYLVRVYMDGQIAVKKLVVN